MHIHDSTGCFVLVHLLVTDIVYHGDNEQQTMVIAAVFSMHRSTEDGQEGPLFSRAGVGFHASSFLGTRDEGI